MFAGISIIITYLLSLICLFPSYYAFIVGGVVLFAYYAAQYLPDFVLALLDCLADILSGIGDMCD